MKVTVSVMGRFHGFNLAEQLHAAGHLQRLITTYPKFETKKYQLPSSQVVSLVFLQIFYRFWDKWPQWLKNRMDIQVLAHEWFDSFAAKYIPSDTELFVGWSASALQGLKAAKKIGAVTVVDEGSSHVLTQMRILTEEYESQGLTPKLSHPKIIERELQEYEECDYITVPSTFVKESFLTQGVSDQKLIHVPYGINLNEFTPIPKEDNIFRIIYCGALSLQKGVHYLLEAFTQLKLPHAELWLIGNLTDEIQPYMQKYDNEKVLHLGPFKQKELYRYYSQGSIFCLPSIQDGFGLVLLQAMACGLPIIATVNTGAPDVVEEGKHGFIIPIRDVEALKNKILYFYENQDLLKEMGKSANKHVRSSYGWEAYGEKIISAYHRILADKI